MKPELDGVESRPISISQIIANDGGAGMRIKLFAAIRGQGQVIASLDVWASNPEAATAISEAFRKMCAQNFSNIIQPVKLVQ